MTKSKNTKHTLYASVLSVMLCIAMLIGATFAWFTDTASTAVNKIQSGTLDVALVDAEGNSLEGETLEWIKAEGAAEDEKVLWEPGCTYKLQPVYVKNNGNLALKFKIVISGIVGDAKLLEAIDFTYGELDVNAEGYLSAGETSKAITIEGHMKEEAGNEFQNLSIEGIAITVYATQNTVENDSYDNQYDKDAFNQELRVKELEKEGYAKVETADEFATAMQNGENIVLAKDITVSTKASLKSGEILDANGYTIILKNNIFALSGSGMTIKNATIKGEGAWGAATGSCIYENCVFDSTSPYISPSADVDIVIKDCTFINTSLQICYNEGSAPDTMKTMIINNTFIQNNTNNANHAIVLGGGTDEFWKNGGETVTVEGNTFTPEYKDISYNAYLIYGDYNITLTQVPVYDNNTFNGIVNYAINSTAIENQRALNY